MTPTSSKNPSKMQSRLDEAVAGLSSSSLSLLNSLMILGVLMSKAEVLAKLKSFSALFEAVTTARQTLAAAVAARVAAAAQIESFYQAFVSALEQALGPANQGLLPGFGVALPKPKKVPSVETKAIAKAKASATREARGIMGKQQRLAITATPSMTVQVLGADGQPVEAPAPSASSAAPSVGAPSSSASSVPVSPAVPKPTP